MPPLSTRAATAVAAVLAAAVSTAVHLYAPVPTAEVRRGSEEAFAAGLQRRELPPRRPPLRWTGDRASFGFRHLKPGPSAVEVEFAGHRGDLVVSSGGVVVGRLPPGTTAGRFPLPATGRTWRDVSIQVPPFVAGDGRTLGAQLLRVALVGEHDGAPDPWLVLVFLVPALGAVGAARIAGLHGLATLTVAAALLAIEAGVLWPNGVVRSPYATRLAGLIVLSLAVAAAFAHACRRKGIAAPWAFAALLAACLVQGILGTSPIMVVSDAVFHANMLARVANGDWFPLSVTQHHPPFRIPYGVSFYALLVPFVRAGLDGVHLVRWGAGLAGIAASAALFVTLARAYGPMAAGLAVALLQCLPLVFDVGYSYGNLSNAFGQAATVGFFAWWARGSSPRGPLIVAGAALLAVAAIAHLSSLIVGFALAGVLLVARRRAGTLDRGRIVAVAAGAALALAYNLAFTNLVLSQVHRLAEGAGRGASSGLFSAMRDQLVSAAWGFGPAALVLAWLGRPWARARAEGGTAATLDRDLTAWWIAAALLAVPAVVSPLEVRYLYALTVPLAAAAGLGATLLHRRGGGARLAGWALVAVQAATGATNAATALFSRYRP